MKVSDFDFDLPPQLIADRPAVPRDAARLLEVAETLRDHVVRDLPALLAPGDLLVFNDTRVIPARLFGHRGSPMGGAVSFLTFPDLGIVVAVTANTGSPGVDPLARRLAETFALARKAP